MRILRTPEPPMPLRPHPFWAVLLLAGLSLPASAQLDSTVRATNMRAGPDDAFPVVMRMPGSSNLSVVGCIESRTWCDVQAGRTRGWVREADLRPSSRVRSAPTVTFSVADYGTRTTADARGTRAAANGSAGDPPASWRLARRRADPTSGTWPAAEPGAMAALEEPARPLRQPQARVQFDAARSAPAAFSPRPAQPMGRPVRGSA